jgi:hypothetical protein
VSDLLADDDAVIRACLARDSAVARVRRSLRYLPGLIPVGVFWLAYEGARASGQRDLTSQLFGIAMAVGFGLLWLVGLFIVHDSRLARRHRRRRATTTTATNGERQ